MRVGGILGDVKEYLEKETIENIVFVSNKIKEIRDSNHYKNKKMDIKELSDLQRYSGILNDLSSFLERVSDIYG